MTAHKLARLVYTMLRYGEQYVDEGQEYYERRYWASRWEARLPKP